MADVALRAEWPGLVNQLHVTVGQEVTPEDIVITLESMKMLTDITAPVAGRVSRIHVAEQEAIDAGTMLLEITPSA